MSMLRNTLRALLLVVACLLAGPRAESASQPVVVIGPANACNAVDVPDQPARAFRDAQGMVHLVASQFVVFASVGKTLLTAKHSCIAIFKSRFSNVPSDFNDYSWLAGFYTPDGRSVVGIIHEEFHGAENKLCSSSNGNGCVQTAIAEAFSKDGGYTFARSSGPGDLLASASTRYLSDQKVWYGFMNPTNIITSGSYQYMLVAFITPTLTDPPQPRSGGICLLRTATPAQPRTWQAWDGKGFNISFSDPYRTASRMMGAPCRSVSTGKFTDSLGSVSWYARMKEFVLVTRCQSWNKGCTPGAYLSLSKDLINWSKAAPLLLDAQASAGGVPQYYPALLDPSASDINFQETGDRPLLFTVEMSKVDGRLGRKLLAYPVNLADAVKATPLP